MAGALPGWFRRRKRRQQEIDAAIDNIKALGKEIRDQHGAMTIEEILSLRHEGHKY